MTFVEINHEIISTAISAPSADSGESMWTYYWGLSLPRDSVSRLTGRLDMTLIVLTGP